jgi:hypothetical protein
VAALAERQARVDKFMDQARQKCRGPGASRRFPTQAGKLMKSQIIQQ